MMSHDLMWKLSVPCNHPNFEHVKKCLKRKEPHMLLALNLKSPCLQKKSNNCKAACHFTEHEKQVGEWKKKRLELSLTPVGKKAAFCGKEHFVPCARGKISTLGNGVMAELVS